MLLDIFFHLLKAYAGSRPKERCDGRGFFYCPVCQRRQPTLLIHADPEENAKDWIPKSIEFYHCEGCQRTFPADDGRAYDYSDSPQPTLTTCFKCGGAVPGHLWRCPHCGFHS